MVGLQRVLVLSQREQRAAAQDSTALLKGFRLKLVVANVRVWQLSTSPMVLSSRSGQCLTPRVPDLAETGVPAEQVVRTARIEAVVGASGKSVWDGVVEQCHAVGRYYEICWVLAAQVGKEATARLLGEGAHEVEHEAEWSVGHGDEVAPGRAAERVGIVDRAGDSQVE